MLNVTRKFLEEIGKKKFSEITNEEISDLYVIAKGYVELYDLVNEKLDQNMLNNKQ